MACAILLELLVIIYQDCFVVRRNCSSPLGCHPGQPDTVVIGIDTMCSLLTQELVNTQKFCSVLGCSGQEGVTSWHWCHLYLYFTERYSHSLISVSPSQLCVTSIVPPPSRFSVPKGALLRTIFPARLAMNSSYCSFVADEQICFSGRKYQGTPFSIHNTR